MNELLVLATCHKALGRINNRAILQIMQRFQPDVIFEEIPDEIHKKIYHEHSILFESEEVEAIKKYTDRNDVANYGVDTSYGEKPFSQNQMDEMYEILSRSEEINRIQRKLNWDYKNIDYIGPMV
ncbi:hypothetical protein [Marispirochaeta sp.]|uniref:hypothetical protein n=1 Tax=Marispirochaeta sp. TaxID=2038653 RepID=UPI003748F977